MRRNPRSRLRVVQPMRRWLGLVVGGALVGVAIASAAGAPTAVHRAAPVPQTAAGPSRATPGPVRAEDTGPGVAHLHAIKPTTSRPHQLSLTRASGRVFDVRKLKGTVVKRERPEHEDPFGPPETSAASGLPSKVSPSGIVSGAAQAPAPGPDSSFAGLDFATWGAGHPPDENGDVGPTYYIQVVNTSIGIYDKSNGSRVAAFTFDTFMSQGQFGNLCDTDNFGDTSDFTVIPANARLQAGPPPPGSSEYFVSTEQFLNALSIYKFHVDWDKPSTSTFTGPLTQLQPNCWPNATPANAVTPANAADVLAIRAMAQAQYTNIGGAESLWVDHTVQRGVSANNTNCNATTGGNATIRWYQGDVTGGTVAATVVQDSSFDPEGANTFFRFMPS